MFQLLRSTLELTKARRARIVTHSSQGLRPRRSLRQSLCEELTQRSRATPPDLSLMARKRLEQMGAPCGIPRYVADNFAESRLNTQALEQHGKERTNRWSGPPAKAVSN